MYIFDQLLSGSRETVYVGIEFMFLMLSVVSPLSRVVPPQTAPVELQPTRSTWHLRLPQSGRAMVLRCPRAYVGVVTDLLPSGWRADPDHVEAQLSGVQVRGAWLACKYRYQVGGGEIRVNVERVAPYGYTCHTVGKGTFRCTTGQPGQGR